MTVKKLLVAYAVLVAGLVSGVLADEKETPDPRSAEFEALCVKLQKDAGMAAEQDVLKILDVGEALGRPYEAAIVVKRYLGVTLEPSLKVQRRAIDNALAVGDFQTVAVRCKRYLSSANSDAASSEVAAILYYALIDVLDSGEDAYRLMTENAGKFRQSISARKFDSWYVEEAARRKDCPGLAARLVLVFSDNLPLEQERLHFWDELDWLIAEIGRPGPGNHAAAADCVKLAGLIRGDEIRKAKTAFYAANLVFKAGVAGKEKEVLDKEFAPVIAAADAYLARRPDAETLKDILFIFADGDPNRGWRENQVELKQQFFVSAFGKIQDKDREELMEWQYNAYIASPEQWIELGTRHRDLFLRSDATAKIPLVTSTKDVALLKKQAAFLQGTISGSAAVINSLAAADDFKACIDHLVLKESWYMNDYGDVYTTLQGMWGVYNAFPRDEQNMLPAGYYDSAMVHFGMQHAVKTAIALSYATARDYVTYAWRSSGQNLAERAAFGSVLASLDWVPYGKKERQDVFSPAYAEFKGWAQGLRQTLEPAQKEVEEARTALEKARKDREQAKADKAAVPATETAKRQALEASEAGFAKQVEEQTARLAEARKKTDEIESGLKLVSPLEGSFKRAMELQAPDLAKAPNPLCLNLATAVKACEDKDTARFMKAARALYPVVKDARTNRTPMGRKILRFLVSPGLSRDMDIIDFQCEVLADQLTRWDPNGRNEMIKELLDLVMSSRPNWGWGRIPKGQQESARKINAVLEKAVEARLGQGNWKTLFDWLIGTRSGQGWNETGWNTALFERIIKEKRLPAVTLMAYVRSYFSGLAETYPVAGYFDDTFVAESAASQHLDLAYWNNGGQDLQRKIRNQAAKMMQDYAVLPFGYGDGAKAPYPRAEFNRWQYEFAVQAEETVRAAMIAGIEARYGTTRFDRAAMGYLSLQYHPGIESAESRKDYFAKLGASLDRIEKTPARMGLPNLGAILKIAGPQDLAEDELAVLMRLFSRGCLPQFWWSGNGYEHAVGLVQGALVERGRGNDLFAIVPAFWKVAKDTRSPDLQRSLVQFSEGLAQAEKHQLATVYSTSALDYFGASLTADAKNKLAIVRSRSMTQVGGAIPVDRSDPRYAIFAAQADYAAGNPVRAWQFYQQKKALFTQTIKELDPEFIMWIVNMNSQASFFDVAEEISRALMTWIDSDPSKFSPEMRGRVILTYADISFYRLEYAKAKALYGKIAVAKEFDGTRAQVDAKLRIAEVDRLAGQRAEAIKQIEELLASDKSRYVQMEGYYRLAQVKYDMEEPLEAQDHLNRVFSLNPSHADGRILEGRVNLMLKDYEKASEIRHVGISLERDVIVPGKALRMSLLDENLALVGKSTAIEIRVWTDSGDEELLLLTPFADSKTRFEGELITALAPKVKGNKVLELLGNDKVRYDFSEGFKKSHKVTEPVSHTMSVVSDSSLYASSGKILTGEEMEALVLEEAIRARFEKEHPDLSVSLSAKRPRNQVKPGNGINVRVVDPDRSITDGKDKIAVKVSTTSGDSISRLPLTETDTHSGVFEGVVPTESATAAAYATDSLEGREPNFAISGGNYPPWVALPDSVKPKVFSIDLNELAALGEMKIDAGVVGRKLKDFVLQVSPNGKNFETIGSWPTAHQAWNGSPTAVLMKRSSEQTPDEASALALVSEVTECIEDASWKLKQVVALDGMAADLDASVLGKGDMLGLGGQDRYVARFSAAFYLPKRQARVFEVRSKNEAAEFVLTVNGEVGEGVDETGRSTQTPRAFSGALNKGVHRVDVYVASTRSIRSEFQLLCDADDLTTMIPCPADMFDPDKHPEIRNAVFKEPAGIVANEDGTSFQVVFGQGARGRVLRLRINDFETDAPAIGKISLQSADGKVLLPTLSDLMALRENARLELVPGDKITISYEDPKYVDKNSKMHEVFLSATYANATLNAVFVAGEGDRVRYVPLRRFVAGDAVAVMINDPDMDVSEKLDVVEFSIRTQNSRPRKLKALETAQHSGVFVGRFFPVDVTPGRDSEILISEGDEIILSYLDRENTDPGIAWARETMIEQAWYQDPEFRVYDVTSAPLSEEELATTPGGLTLALVATRPEEPEQKDAAHAMLGGSVLAELLWPTIARSPESQARIFAQTLSGREARGAELVEPFDTNVVNTTEITARVGGAGSMQVPPGYARSTVVGDRFAGEALDDGRFVFSIPLTQGEDPNKGRLSVKSDDEVYIGFQYIDDKGDTNWLVRRVVLGTDAFFDVMDADYKEEVTQRYIGESVYFRAIDLKKDVSGDRDDISIGLASGSGIKTEIGMKETFPHSGVFMGLAKFVYDDGSGLSNAMASGIMPVVYGDTVTAAYDPGDGRDVLERKVGVYKGSDGDILPFTKRYKDPEMAVRTRFTIAEAYFELAKKHRQMDQQDVAEREIAEGKRLMEEALRGFPDTDLRVQADYLLANLVLELADETKDPKLRDEYYGNAVAQFANIVSTYKNSSYAPKAQFKKALALEKMGDIDSASDEYVKLSYRWPDSELVAETIARLGQYFFGKGKELADQAKVEEDVVQKDIQTLNAKEMFVTAAEVFGSLGEKFPGHKLADKATALSAQSYMRAEAFEKAIKTFKGLTARDDVEKDLRAEAMYWCADCYTRIGPDSMIDAYRMFKNLTWDYPESKWAKFARGRLTEEEMVELDDRVVEEEE